MAVKTENGTAQTMEANGSALTLSAVGVCDDSAFDDTTNRMPDVYFVFSGAFQQAPTVYQTLDVYEQTLNINGSDDAPSISAAYLHRYVASMQVDAVTTKQTLSSPKVPAPVTHEARYYVHNNTSATLSSSWSLKVVPCSLTAT